MPIVFRIDHINRLVIACGQGVMTHDDIYEYQAAAWNRPDVAGFNELVDMSGVTEAIVNPPPADSMRSLAAYSAGMEQAGVTTKFAIVAPSDAHFGLGRMYAAYRSMTSGSSKEVGVFRSLTEALMFLGIEKMPEFPKA